MFDLNDPTTTRSHKDNPWDRLPQDAEPLEESADNELDNEENQELFKRLIGYYQRELDRQADSRIQQSIDEDFYDSIQWSEEDAYELRKRGQAPISLNVIAQTINWIIGSEKRGRTDFNVLPREKNDSQPAERKTQLLKYLSDVNRTQFHRSRAFEDAVKVGIGWLEDGIQNEDDGEPVYSGYESWRNILWDSSSTELDLSDCRYVIRTKWVDEDVAKAYFPDRSELIYKSASEADRMSFDAEYGDEVMDSHEMALEGYSGDRMLSVNHRRRVRMIEVWFTRPERVDRIIQGDFAGEIYDPEHPGHQAVVEEMGQDVIASRTMLRMYLAVMTPQGLCYLGPSPYRHNQFPFTPIWGYRRGRDNLPYGVIRGLRDIQEDINKRASKALYILSSNKVIMDEGAVEDIEEFRREVARPDSIITKKPGRELVLNADRELAGAHLELMNRHIGMIQQVGGVTDELLGRTTNATSGKAIEARQMQGSMTTAKLFDNLRYAVQAQGEKQLSLVEQFFTEEKRFRITNMRGTPEYVAVNDGLPENDIARSRADFVISEGEWRATMRQAQADQLLEVMTRMPPEISVSILDLVVEMMDVPNRDELVSRIRQINGQRDPDAEELTPEEEAAMEAQQQQAMMQQAMFEAELREKLAKAGKTEAEAQRIAAQIMSEQAKLAGTNVDTQSKALDVAMKALLAPPAVDVADGVLHESGFVSRTEIEQQAQEQAMLEQQAMEEQAMQEQAMMEEQAAQEQMQEPGMPIDQQAAQEGMPPMPDQGAPM